MDARTGEAIVGATIRLLTRPSDGAEADANSGEVTASGATGEAVLSGTVTGSDGAFSLSIRAIDGTPQKWVLEVRHLGYETWRQGATDVPAFLSSESSGPLSIRLQPDPFESGEVFVTATRADVSTPHTFTTMGREEIEQVNQARDIPFLVSQTPSVVATSDAGTGIGYTGIRIRGVDPTRINVTLNGIPLNDAESQGVFWVNLPDLAGSTQSIQIQRGVGSSTHGAGAFGATMNLQTGLLSAEPTATVHSTLGSFATRKASLFLGSGLLGGGWAVEGRLSTIQSGGYIDRATADLNSFHVATSRRGERSLLKLDVLSGREITYQAWNGVPEPLYEGDQAELERYISSLWIGAADADHLRANLGNRRFNEFTYDQQVDNYRQDHLQAQYSLQTAPGWLLTGSAHYTFGRGYFEEYKRDQSLQDYSIAPVLSPGGADPVKESDLIRRRWLRNHFYGGIMTLEGELGSSLARSPIDPTRLTAGLAFHAYDGDHFGQVIWAPLDAPELQQRRPHRYYFNNGRKADASGYVKLIHPVRSDLRLYGDLQLRSVQYDFLGKRNLDQSDGSVSIQEIEQTESLLFFNPKAGVVWSPSDRTRLYASFAVGSKEPTRDDYVDSTPQSRPRPEFLYNTELGWERMGATVTISANAYAMLYRDQLILTGSVNDVGEYVRQNVDRSHRLGVELSASARPLNPLEWSGSLTLSRNRIPRFHSYLDDYDQGGQLLTIHRDTPIAFSPSVVAKHAFTVTLGDLEASLFSQLVSRQYLDNTGARSRSLDGFHQHDLRIQARAPERFRLGARSLEWSVSIINLMDAEIVSNGYTFGFIAGGQTEYFTYLYPQAGRHLLGEMRIRF